MSQQPKREPMTADDVFWLVLVMFVLLFVGGSVDSCHAGWRYRDLRDRLQRLEQRP